MGKGRSPGKWFKNFLLGKKSSSKSNSSKKNDIFKPSTNKDVLGSSELTVSGPTVDSLLISPPISGANDTKAVLSEKEVITRSSHDKDILSAGDEEALEKLRLTEAAIKVQAACRGYQARRTFQTLKGIIQVQALIRGHLVRRQAVSALYCVKGIVKLQALARGYNVRRSDIGLAVLKIRQDTKCSSSIGEVTTTQDDKLSESVFVRKLLASSSSAVPLSLSFDPGEPNLVSVWLDHWTRSHFWAPLPELKKKLDCVSDEKNGSLQAVKRNTRKSSTVKAGDGSVSGSNKSKQRPKKDSNRPLLTAQEHPQKEIDKSSFKKTRMQNVSDRSEVFNEKRKHSSRKISDHTVTDVSELGPSASSEKMKDLAVSESKESDPEKSLGQQVEDKHDNEPHNDPIARDEGTVLQTSVMIGGDEGTEGVSDDLNGGDNCINNNYKRRASLPANFNDQDNELHNTPRLPSYMAPTESAKAKLRAQGSPRFASDLVDKNVITRRHSLSSSLNGKSDSFSPRAERLVAMSGRGVIRTDRSLSSSRDGTDKLIQPQWRR